MDNNPLNEQILEVASESFLGREPPKIRGRAYVVKALEADIWAFAKGRDFRETVLLAVNLGEDAIFGGILVD